MPAYGVKQGTECDNPIDIFRLRGILTANHIVVLWLWCGREIAKGELGMNARCFSVFVLLLGQSCLPAFGDPAVLNPGFETGTPGPGVATGWYPYYFGPPVSYQIMSYSSAPWAVYDEKQSQMWYGGGGGAGGIYQEVIGFGSGTYEYAVMVRLQQGAGETLCRVGVQPGGGPPVPGSVIYGGEIYLSDEWQVVSVTFDGAAPVYTLVIEGYAGPGNPGGSFGGVADNNNAQQVQLCYTVASVPDACQPPANPLGVADTTNWCAPTAAANITWFWDQVVTNPPSPGVNDNWNISNANAYIGWWMDTNDLGCALRKNGTVFLSAPGTYVGDMAPGLKDYSRWDSTHNQGTVPPAVPASKNGYDWTVTTYHNQTPNYNLNNALAHIALETSEGRPLLVMWSYWNLNNNTAWTDPSTGVVYYDWGPPVPSSDDPCESWNNYENQSGQPQGDQQIGHVVTVVGWCNVKDPDGAGGALPSDKWIICHDTWAKTPVDIAVPWNNNALGASSWVSNTIVRPRGTLDTSIGPMSPADHWTPVSTVTNVMAQVRLTAGPAEGVSVQRVVLQAQGTGNSVNDITRVDLVSDTNSNGLWDVGEVSVANAVYVAGAPPTCTLNLNAAFTVPVNQSRDLLIHYTMRAGLAAGFTYKCQITSMTTAGQRSGLAITPRGLPFTSAQKTLIQGPCVKIPNVPDIVQPPNNPLGVPAVTNWCGPASSANVTYYWAASGDARAAGVNDNWAANDGQYYMGWWMDTNNLGCQFRANGSSLVGAGGTYVADLAPGIVGYARWDAGNSFGVINPLSPAPTVYPMLPVSKQGHSWTCSSKHDATPGYGWAAAWADVVKEIDAGRPVLVTWRYWNLVGPTTVGGIEYYTWGPPNNNGQCGETYNDASNENEAGKGDGTIGHIVTVVGYCPNTDPDGAGPLPQRDWIICHDTWGAAFTGTDVAVPWYRTPPPGPNITSPWAANTFVRLAAPAKAGKLTPQGAVFVGLNKKWVAPGTSNVQVVSMSLAADATESVIVNVIELVASGTGNDATRITSVKVFWDDDGDAVFDPPGSADPDVLLASGVYPADNGTLRLVMDGPSKLAVAAGLTKRIFVAYDISALAPTSSTYTCKVQAVYATGGTTFLPVTIANPRFNGVPYTGYTVGICQIVVPPPYPPGKTGWWKTQPDGTQTTLTLSDGPVVTSGTTTGGVVRLGDRIYVEEADRSSGIAVYVAGETVPTLPENTRISLEAVIDTIDGERALVQPVFLTTGAPPNDVKPLALSNLWSGGGNWSYDDETGAGQKGILDAHGLNNIGLLVRVFGRVTDVDPTSPPEWFTLDDGSGVSPSLKVALPDNWTGLLPVPPQYATVTGICSCERDAETGELSRLVRVRMPGDVQAW